MSYNIDSNGVIFVRNCTKSLCGHQKNNKDRIPKIPFSSNKDQNLFDFFGFLGETKKVTLVFNHDSEIQNLTAQNNNSEKTKGFECQFNGNSNIGKNLYGIPEEEIDNTYIVFIKIFEMKDTFIFFIIKDKGLDAAHDKALELYNNEYAQEYGGLNTTFIQESDDLLLERDPPYLMELSKLREEARTKIQQSQGEKYRDIELSPEFKNIYSKYVSKSGEPAGIEYLKHTAKLTTKGRQFVYIPNIWFLLGVDMVDFYKELALYKFYYTKVVKKLGITNDKDRDKYANILYETYDNISPNWKENKNEFMDGALRVFKEDSRINDTDVIKYAEMLWSFASNGYQSWIGKLSTEINKSKKDDTQNNKDNTKKISRNDFRDSVVLDLLNLVATAQGYVTKIMAAYATDKSFQKFLDNKQLIIAGDNKSHLHISKNDPIYEKGGINKVVYGTPGCGKSTYVDKLIGKIPSEHIIRTTFYQDYTYTDFVGQILPEVQADGAVSYCFNPGPFTQALELAFANPKEKVVLVIEELNRGNAPSIFGDMFQLLDRCQDVKEREGEGRFTIRNRTVQEYLKTKGLELDDIWIPANFSIYATMNTSDQNVFTLDTAFKRRWDFEKLHNEFEDTHPFAKDPIPGMTDVTWRIFVEALNAYIVNCKDLFKSEDKLLGVYFVTKETLKNKNDFAYKVFEYLWDDVFKNNHEYLFKKEITTLDTLLKEYTRNGKGKDVFNDDFIGQLRIKTNNYAENNSDNEPNLNDQPK